MEDLLKPLKFPQIHSRPYFITSFVSTIDGKIFVNRPGYWPIGSSNDYEYFTWIRAHADVIIEGRNTALKFGSYTIKTIHSEKFQAYRKQLGKAKPIDYIILTSRPDAELAQILKNDFGYKPLILTSEKAEPMKEIAEVLPIGVRNGKIVLSEVTEFMKGKYQHVFLDVGPTLLTSFLKEKLVDELFLTIAPKFFGNHNNEAITMGESGLFSPENIPQWKLQHAKQVGDEVFLRYRRS